VSTRAFVGFGDTSDGGNATIIANGSSLSTGAGGDAFFGSDSDAGNATLIANGTQPDYAAGTITFADAASGGNSQVKLFGTGNLVIGYVNHPTLTVGSLEGDGNVVLGGRSLAVGRNGLSTRFDGVISGTGSLTKIGGGRLTLTNANTYTAGTTVMRGFVLVNNTSGSGTGTGPVSVHAGALGGSGIVSGALTIGTDTGPGATLAPGKANAIGTLTLGSTLTLKGDATYDFGFNSSRVTTDNVVAKGITIMTGAVIFMTDNGAATLPVGTVFTALSNTATTPIAGIFANLADAAVVTIGSNKFQANYEGGDGNDLTMTVVP
jgi:fibronectin-binding autotransporter adhesin